ncbi:MAG: galactokinase [Bryobacteraceae bacterium]
MKRRFRAPGRVNLIGEHTDYNLGFVLPIAIDLACIADTSPAKDGKLHIYSENRRSGMECAIADLPQRKRIGHWSDYVIGVARELHSAGFPIEPREIRIHSTVPPGSGLSSSASLEVSCALALLAGRPMDRLELAKICQRAEGQFVGMPCGIMDQYVSLFGAENAAIRIDCRSLTHEVLPLPPGVEIIAVNSMVKHELCDSAYKQRTLECAAAVESIRSQYPSTHSLRDVDPSQFGQMEPLLAPIPARRARHVVTENARVNDFCTAAGKGDLTSMGRLFVESHRSLQRDYEVSCEELDFLVDAAIGIEGVYGARMTGGGFGGCTVNLVAASAAADFGGAISARYHRRFGIEPAIYRCRPASGAQEL